jgi:hypothetical protein
MSLRNPTRNRNMQVLEHLVYCRHLVCLSGEALVRLSKVWIESPPRAPLVGESASLAKRQCQGHPVCPIPPPPAAEWDRRDERATILFIALKLVHPWLKAMGVYLGQSN